MTKSSYACIKLCVLLLSLVGVVPFTSAAGTIAPILLPPEDRSYRGPEDPLILEFPYDVLTNVDAQLALEINAVDVSSLVTVDGNRVVINPPSPFSPGFYELRLVEYSTNGDINELGQWRFEIRQNLAFQSQQFVLRASVNNSYLASRDYSYDESNIDRYGANGGVSVGYQASSGENEVNFVGDLIYQKDVNNGAVDDDSKELDLSHYLLNVEVGEAANLSLGHHAVNYQSLTYQNFNRRGISADVKLPAINSSITAFSSRANDIIGFEEGLGFDDADNRVSGVVLKNQPFSQNPSALTVSASYISGTRTSNDDSLGLYEEKTSGDATSVSFDSLLLDQRWRVYLDLSRSSHSFEESETILSEESDRAYQFFTVYSFEPLGAGDAPWQIDLSLESREVGPNFYSLSNRYLARDREYKKVASQIAKSFWVAELYFETEEDNLDDRFDATNQTETFGVNFNYSGGESDYVLLGSPSYTVDYIHSENNQQGEELDALLVPLPSNDSATDTFNFMNEFVYSRGSWYYSIYDAKFDDKGGAQPDTDTRTIGLGGNLELSQNHSLNISRSDTTTSQENADGDSDQITYSLGLNSFFEPIALQSQITVNYDQIENYLDSTATFENDRMLLSAALTKRLRQAKGLFPGIDLQLKAQHADYDDKTVGDEDYDFYEFFISLNFNWDVDSNRLGGSR